MRNMEEEYNDAEQMFVISDEQVEPSRQITKTNIDLNLNEEGAWTVVKYIAIAFITLCIVSGIAKSSDSDSGKVSTAFAFFFLIASGFIYFMLKSAKGYKKHLEDSTVALKSHSYDLKRNRIANKKQKKFNSITEHNNSVQRKLVQVDKERERSDNIELAVEALVRLGFKYKKAMDWVSRGLDSGIEHSDTQKLVKYALGRGTIVN